MLLAMREAVALFARIAKSFDGCNVHNRITLAMSSSRSLEIRCRVGCSISVLWNCANGE